MKLRTSFALVLLGALALSVVSYRLTDFGGATQARGQAVARYRLDASQSRFMVRAFSGGLLWFKGHDHFVAARDFSGEAQLTPGALGPASLTLSVRAASLAETRD